MSEFDYDLLVIGSGPAGQRAAIQAAKLDKRVAIIERKLVLGGVSINTGTIPSKTLREAILHLSGYRERGLYGASYTVKEHITMSDLLFRTEHVISHEIDVTRSQLLRNRVETISIASVAPGPPARSTWPPPASRPTRAGGSSLTRCIRPRCRISTPSAI
jgi:NAD(P) transhydrogenase